MSKSAGERVDGIDHHSLLLGLVGPCLHSQSVGLVRLHFDPVAHALLRDKHMLWLVGEDFNLRTVSSNERKVHLRSLACLLFRIDMGERNNFDFTSGQELRHEIIAVDVDHQVHLVHS